MTFKRVLLLLVLAGAMALGAVFTLAGSLHRPLQIDDEQMLFLAPGSSLSQVLADAAADGWLGEGIDRQARMLAARAWGRLTGVSQRLQVGEYRISDADSLWSLLERLQRGDVVQRSFTLVEGWSLAELRAALARVEGLKVASDGMDGAALMAALGRPGRHPEGWFAADTYFYTRGDSDLDLLARALQRQEQVLDALWATRQPDLPYEDAYDALIMASIVEKETGVPDERARIAGVFVSRLRQGMRLQTDPTVIYGMGPAYDGNIRRADLLRPTPYNTYVIHGLPPTPIAMPGEDAIRAALAPEETGELFFVARGDGSHVFSRTLAEHEAAVRQYQLKRRSDYRSSPGPGQ